jgi:glycosyltransferase involved in cell wall biosynthesis
MYHGDLTALLARTMTARCPVVWGVHSGSVPMREHPWLTRLVIRSCALVSSNPEAIVFASNSARQFHESLGYTGRRHLVIPNGIEAEMVQAADSRRRELRRQWRVPDEAFVVGALSRYHPMKDHATLLDAVQLLRAQGRPVFLVMAGRGLEHANEPLKQMIEDRALGGVARLLGEQKDVGAFLSTCDVLASSSVTESFPMSFLEALATGLPIVTTDVGDCADIVGDAGRVVPVRSPAKFAVALSEIADLPLESRQTLAAVARETVTRRYSVDRYVDAFAELYEAALASAEGRAARTDHN